jgi:hypothetical protein
MERVTTKDLIGASPIDVLSRIVQLNPEIESVNLWKYSYVPLQTEERGDGQVWLTKDEVLENARIHELVGALTDTEQLAIGSKVKMALGKIQHIPLMDFNVSKSPENTKLVIKRLKYIGFEHGWILETEKSYHYWGISLIPDEEWADFMGRSLLTSIVHDRANIQLIADTRYIGHSLRRGCNTIRLSTRADKTFRPTVVAFLGYP